MRRAANSKARISRPSIVDEIIARAGSASIGSGCDGRHRANVISRFSIFLLARVTPAALSSRERRPDVYSPIASPSTALHPDNVHPDVRRYPPVLVIVLGETRAHSRAIEAARRRLRRVKRNEISPVRLK